MYLRYAKCFFTKEQYKSTNYNLSNTKGHRFPRCPDKPSSIFKNQHNIDEKSVNKQYLKSSCPSGHKKSSEGGIRTLDTTGMNRVL